MKKNIYYVAGSVIALLAIFFTAWPGTSQSKKNKIALSAEEPGFVVMELFTSQGCSSCPPADEILGTYALKNDEHIIPLAYHVDYWNRLGWIDSFSNSLYSQRQTAYAERSGLGSIYTPQLIINGQKQMVGSDKAAIKTAIEELLQEKVTVVIKVSSVQIKDGTLFVDYVLNERIFNSVINAALVQQQVVTRVRGGENRGVKLNNYNVVRDFKTIQQENPSGHFMLQLPKGSNAAGYQVVLFVQENNSGIIKGAVKVNCK